MDAPADKAATPPGAAARLRHIASRIVAGVLVPILFATSTLWLVAYFGLNGSWARSWLKDVTAPGGLVVGVHRFGPWPTELRLGEAVLGADGVALVRGGVVAEVALFPVALSGVDLSADEVVIRPGAAARAPRADGEPERPVLAWRDLDAALGQVPGRLSGRVSVLWIHTPQLEVCLEDVQLSATGATSTLLTASRCELRDLVGPAVWGGGACRVEVRRPAAGGPFELEVELEGGLESLLSIAIGLAPAGDTVEDAELSFSVDARLEAALAAHWAGGRGPGAITLRGLRADAWRPGPSLGALALSFDALAVESFTADAATFDGLQGGRGRVLVEPDGLLTRVEVGVESFGLDALKVGDFSLQRVDAGRLAFVLDRRVDGAFEALSVGAASGSSFALETIRTDLVLAVGLAGGSLRGLLETPEGDVAAVLSVKRSPLGGRTSVLLKSSSRALSGQLLEAFAGDAPEFASHPAASRPALVRDAEIVLEVDDGALIGTRDAVTVERDGRIWRFDGYDWSVDP